MDEEQSESLEEMLLRESQQYASPARQQDTGYRGPFIDSLAELQPYNYGTLE